MNKVWWRWVLAVILIVILGVLFYSKVYQPKSTYLTLFPQSGSFEVSIQGIGSLDAQFIYQLGFPVSGRITELYADQGDVVSAGLLLAQLDSSELRATLQENKALLEKTQLEIQATQQDIQLNQERYNLAKLLHERNKTMLQKQAISQAKFDESESSKMQAKIAFETAQTRLKLIRAERHRIEKSAEVIEAKLANLKLYAPVEGIIIERMVEEGESLVPGLWIDKV